jgi:hypothetical protein
MRRVFTKGNLETVKGYLELVKYIVEIAAIVVAGLWAYSKYLEIERPMELRISSVSDLEWYRTPNKDNCLGRLGVTIKNIGTKPFHIDKVDVRAWLVDKATIGKPFKLIFLEKEKKALLDQQVYDSKQWTSLIGTYAVDEDNQIDFTYLMKKAEGSVAYFVVKATGKDIDIEESRWGFVCDYK